MVDQTSKRWDLCQPEIILGRKVWVARRGFHGSSIPEVWIHVSPYHKHIAYIKGRSLNDGTAEQDADYLATLVSDKIKDLPPIAPRLEEMWDEEVAEIAADHAAADA